MYTSRCDLIKGIGASRRRGLYEPRTAVVLGPSTREQGSLLSIQILRGLAALSVVVAHLSREFEIKLGVPDPLPTSFILLGNAGVDLFFVISGFIMVHVAGPLFGRRNASWQFFLRRAARIIPLYWATTGVLLVYVLLNYSDLASANLSVQSVVASFIFFLSGAGRDHGPDKWCRVDPQLRDVLLRSLRHSLVGRALCRGNWHFCAVRRDERCCRAVGAAAQSVRILGEFDHSRLRIRNASRACVQ
jgi:hypothetical protein